MLCTFYTTFIKKNHYAQINDVLETLCPSLNFKVIVQNRIVIFIIWFQAQIFEKLRQNDVI